MKLKTILGVFTGIVGAMICSASVYAASIELGTPVTVDTASGTTTPVYEYKAGTTVAVPIYLYPDSETDTVNNYGISAIYDENYLVPTGVNGNTYSCLGTAATNSGLTTSEGRRAWAFNATKDEWGDYGTYYYSKNDTAHMVGIVASGTDVVLADTENKNLVGYFMFSIVKDVDADTALNTEIIKLNPDALDATTIRVNDGSDERMTAKFTKANGCLTAFQVDVDNDQVAKTGYWIQRLYAVVGDTEADLSVYNNEDGSATYSFPARVVTDSQSAVSDGVQIYAEVSKEQDATETTTVLLGTINGLTTDSTVTDYGTPTTITSVPVE